MSEEFLGLQMEVSDSVPEGTVFFMALPPEQERPRTLEELADWYRKNAKKRGIIKNLGQSNEMR